MSQCSEKLVRTLLLFKFLSYLTISRGEPALFSTSIYFHDCTKLHRLKFDLAVIVHSIESDLTL